MDRTHKSKATINMTNLSNNLPSLEELRFRQAVQCTTCLNTGHSTVECNLRTHCMICHSNAHSVDRCDYTLLNKSTTTIRQIQSYQDNSRSRNEDRYDNRYQTERRNDNRRYQNDRNNYRQDDREDQRQDMDNQNFSPERDNNNRQSYNGERYSDEGKYNKHRGFHKRYNKSKGSRHFQHNNGNRNDQDLQEKNTPQYVKGESSGSTIPNCYICRKDGHYANQCPTKDKGKAPTVNMVSPAIQQVTTRSKTKQSEWEVQEAVRKAAKEWVEEANKNNAARMI